MLIKQMKQVSLILYPISYMLYVYAIRQFNNIL